MWPRAKLGMAMLILTESVFFFMLILAFVYFRDESVKTAAANLNLAASAIYTACLLASSFTMWRTWASATMVLGSVFLVGQASEYLRLLRHGITISQGLFGTTFFTLTGIHGLHVLIGLVLLGLARIHSAAMPAVSMYWHFVAVVWIVIFAIVYLGTFL
jgi:heme/copper-type cytochrome/quinol oxidase subunit 3